MSTCKSNRATKSIVRAVTRNTNCTNSRYWYMLNFSKSPTGKKIEAAHAMNDAQTFDRHEHLTTTRHLKVFGSIRAKVISDVLCGFYD